MKTVGLVLKNARLVKQLSLAQVESSTKIKTRILEQIESDEIDNFNSFGHALGLIKNYGEFLGLNTTYLTALFRRQINTKNRKPSIAGFNRLLSPLRTQILAFLLLILVFSYLIFQLINLRTGPKIELSQPQNGLVVKLSKITVAGKTEPEAQILINGQKIATNLSGEFSAEFELSPGMNSIEVVAKKGEGTESRITRNVEFSAN